MKTNCLSVSNAKHNRSCSDPDFVYEVVSPSNLTLISTSDFMDFSDCVRAVSLSPFFVRVVHPASKHAVVSFYSGRPDDCLEACYYAVRHTQDLLSWMD